MSHPDRTLPEIGADEGRDFARRFIAAVFLPDVSDALALAPDRQVALISAGIAGRSTEATRKKWLAADSTDKRTRADQFLSDGVDVGFVQAYIDVREAEFDRTLNEFTRLMNLAADSMATRRSIKRLPVRIGGRL